MCFFHRGAKACPAVGPKTAVMLAVMALELPSRAAAAAVNSSLRPARAAPVAADARYTCSSSRPLIVLRRTAAVVSAPLAMVVVVVESRTLPLAEAPPLLPQAAPRTPMATAAAISRRGRLGNRIIVIPFRLR